jgi:hypothetical protein
MLNVPYESVYLLAPFCWFFLLNWVFFFKTNFYTVRILKAKGDKNSKNNVNKKFHFSIVIYWGLLNLIPLLFSINFQHGTSTLFFWDHLNSNNLTNSLVAFILYCNISFLLFIFFLRFTKVSYNTDYIFALVNLSNFFPFLFLANNIFTMFFVLELNSTIVFYKFIMSKVWYSRTTNNQKNSANTLNKNLSQNYISVLFYQYWTTFFSSTLFLFFLINLIYLYGSTDFFFLNMLENSLESRSYYFNTKYKGVLFFILIFSVMLKVGFAPMQLFKIEIYKGIPLLSIFFYTTFYFLVYFLYFNLLIICYLKTFNTAIYYPLFLFIVIGGGFIVSLLFDVTALKAFLAYSSLINSILFLSLILIGIF